VLGKNSSVIEGIYQQLGGRISVMIKDGAGHHPHSLRDPKPIADFITQSVQPASAVAPDYLGSKVAKSSFYSVENFYRDFPSEGNFHHLSRRVVYRSVTTATHLNSAASRVRSR
jgi:hypothetical protein